MSTILLLRHAENDYFKKGLIPGRIPGIHLNEPGRQHARAIAGKMAEMPVKAVYSSPLERAVETATAVAERLNQQVIQRPGLIELDCGDWAGKSGKSVRRRKDWWKVQLTPSLYKFTDGESYIACQQRIVNEIEELRHQHAPEDIVVCVSHGDPIKLCLAFYLGMPLDMFQRLLIAPASYSTIQFSEMGARVANLSVI